MPKTKALRQSDLNAAQLAKITPSEVYTCDLMYLEEVPDVLLRCSDILVEDLRPVYNLRLLAIQHLPYLPSYQRLSCMQAWAPL